MRYAFTAAVLFALWLMMSGIYKPLIVSFGLVSSIGVALIVRRMDQVDGSRLELSLSPLRFLAYFGWLLVEIVKANWAVTRIILARRPRTHQHMFFVPASQRTNLGQVVFANSITLTPGTITVETEPGRFLVHALDFGPQVPGELAEMDRRVAACETSGAA